MSRLWIDACPCLFCGRPRSRALDVARCAQLVLSLVPTLSAIIAFSPSAAADRYPFWARNFNYLPTFSATSGMAPLQTTAQWASSLAVLVDASRWSDYPWYEHITLDWGDGTLVRVPTSTMGPVAGTPTNLVRKTWPTQSLSHTYDAKGSYTVRLIYEKPGIIDADVLATVSVSAPTPPPSSQVVVAINAGGPTVLATDGTEYTVDQLYSGSSKTNTNGEASIAGTRDDKLYQSERIGTGTLFGYDLPMTNGTYDITLKFAENQFERRRKRVFDIALEGKIALNDLDLFAAAGGKNIAYDVTRRVSVSDGKLDVDFIKVVGYPKVNAILVRNADAVTASANTSAASDATTRSQATATIEPAAVDSTDDDPGTENAGNDEPSCLKQGQACPAKHLYEISYMAFVPANYVRLDARAATCRARDGALAPLVLSGDDRGFDAEAQIRNRYRVLQRALVIERTGADGRPRFSLASSETVVRPDLTFRAGNGAGSVFHIGDRLPTDADTRDQLGDCKLLHARAADRRAGWQDPFVVGRTAKTIKLAFHGVVHHGLLPDLMPQTAWDFALSIDASTEPPRISVRGWHTGFPAHEIYVNGEPLVRYSPLGRRKLPTLSLDLSGPSRHKESLQPVRASVLLPD